MFFWKSLNITIVHDIKDRYLSSWWHIRQILTSTCGEKVGWHKFLRSSFLASLAGAYPSIGRGKSHVSAPPIFSILFFGRLFLRVFIKPVHIIFNHFPFKENIIDYLSVSCSKYPPSPYTCPPSPCPCPPFSTRRTFQVSHLMYTTTTTTTSTFTRDTHHFPSNSPPHLCSKHTACIQLSMTINTGEIF